jgi:hypothetical protein
MSADSRDDRREAPTPISRVSVEAVIMDLACDDYTGLYEVLWRLNTLHPDTAPDLKRFVAQQAMSSLLSQRYVQLFRALRGGEHEQLSESRAEVLIRRPESWEPPGGPADEYCCVASTTGGEQAYDAGKFAVS